MKFALFIGNRGFFPEKLLMEARKEITACLKKQGIEVLCSPADMTRYGAVETYAEGRAFAKFLAEHKGEYDGVILTLPNFGDENGASEALRDCGVPIFIQAYPDELDKMDFASRRDAFCGKFSIMDVFHQNQIPFTAWPPHTISPKSPKFAEQIRQFSAVCRIVNGLKRLRVGAIGARPTLFKTIRFDETALQKYGITTEVFDNSDLLVRMDKIKDDDSDLKAKIKTFKKYANFSKTPAKSIATLARISVALDRLIGENELGAVALRCWSDLQLTAKVAPCMVLGELNDRGIPAACELDIGNTIAMKALQLASQEQAACLDWNNNYADDDNKCILFHCGSTAQKLMTAKGDIIPHKMFAKVLGDDCSYGCDVGFIRPMDFSFASTTTENGKMLYYSGEGRFTGEPLGEGFFGCGGVAEIDNLQAKLNAIGYAGYRHHVSITPGFWKTALDEAFTRYLGYTRTEI